MKRRQRTKLVQEGKYVAEVDVEQIETDEGWSPYLSLEDAYKLDAVCDALLRGRFTEDKLVTDVRYRTIQEAIQLE